MGCFLKDKKGIKTTSSFQNILNESNRKPNKIWVDKGIYFYNKSMKSWLQDYDKKLYSAHSDGKSVVAEKFVVTLKNKFYKHMIWISKNASINKLDDIINEYINTHYRTIKMKPDVENNDKYRKYGIGDYGIISKYKNIFAKF